MSHAYSDSFLQGCPDQNIDAMWAAYADSCRIEELESENAKLRELVKRYHRLATGTDELWSWQSVYAELRELGVEVDG